MPGRKVTYKLKKPDFIVITAETAGGRSYIRYAEGPQGIRGFTLGYDRALAGSVERLVIAVANSFMPFPEEGGGQEGPKPDAPKADGPRTAPAPAVAAASRASRAGRTS